MERINFLETEHLLLRKAKESDLNAIWKNVWADDSLAEMMLWKPTHSYEDAKNRVDRSVAFQAEHDAFFVCLKETDEPIGFCGITEKEPGVFAECGICIAKKEQGKGLGTEVLGALLRLAFSEFGGRQFVYSCDRENAVSAALCKHYGFQYERSEQGVREWDSHAYVDDIYILNNPEAGGK